MKSEKSSLLFAKARRGQIVSILDACILSLRPKRRQGTWPECSFVEITRDVSRLRGHEVASDTVRSVVYKHSDLFERTDVGGKPKWRLSKRVRSLWE